MKKTYEEPWLDIEKFQFIATLDGIGQGLSGDDPNPSDEEEDPF